ncbi:carbamate kinase [Candidatus Saccharibacteria bacterium]|nr:carbamate kinase [Candidatus Saccharibacteria bacterium]MBR6122547.1 carbamate kinase [Candidatus Saccharibacteria bacterium]
MVKKRVVIALGGNALQKNGEVSAEAQKKVAEKVGSLIAELSSKYEIIVAHGNGPQVGNILIHEEQAASDKAPAMPLETAVAMSQGQIGYWLAQSIQNAFLKEGKNKKVATVVTQVEVDKKDPAFKNPTKPVGQFYTEKEALKLAKEKGWLVKEDSGRGYRRVVPSPKPKSIIEKREISDLVKSGAIVIAAGGGGVPVYRTKILRLIKGVDAVIDKDFAAEKLAELIKADMFISVTAVDYAYINFGTPDQSALKNLTSKEAEYYSRQGFFKAGSMLPKITAATEFAKKGKVGIICSLDNLEDALKLKSGTIITR